MAVANHISRTPYVHPADPAGHLKPDEPLAVDGLDWAWAFVLYKEIPGFPAYRAGTNGLVWSQFKIVRPPGPRNSTYSVLSGQWHIKRPYTDKYGYIAIQLYRDGEKPTRRLSRLVLETFVGPCPPGMEACHNNGDRADNRLANLRWDTPKGNHADKERHGTAPRGERHGMAKITLSDLHEMIELKRSGWTYKAIGARYGLSKQHTYAVIKGRSWAHVPR